VSHGPSAPVPAEQQQLKLGFALPHTGRRIDATGQVMWRYDSPDSVAPRESVALGVRFVEVSAAHRLELRRYFFGYRYRVAVAFASDEQRLELSESLAEHTQLHFAQTDREVDDLLGRGDVSVLLVCGDDELRAMSLVRRLASRTAADDLTLVGPADDLAPRLVYAAAGTADTLLEQLNAGNLFCSVPRPTDDHKLRAAVLRACGDYGVRTEHRRDALALQRALQREQARARPAERLERVVSDTMVSKSAQMDQVLRSVRTVAPHAIGVLLQGETGTGKEVVARLIHELSDRAEAAFVVQDCGALTESLLDSELFGHIKGAFTGAIANHPGLFVLADGGTIVLDEIENTSPSVQAKLLRVIETGEIRAVGGSHTRHVDVRVIAASNKDLEEEMRNGGFRLDLYFRLATFPIVLPPLRERRDDIMPLAEHFLARANRSLQKSVRGLSGSAQECLLCYPWPGNVRELHNVIERATLLAPEDALIQPSLFPETLRRSEPAQDSAPTTFAQQMEAKERMLIATALERHGGVVRRAAEELHMNPVTLSRRARRHGLLPKR